MLNVSNIDQYYRESHTLWDLDLQVNQGSVTYLMGRNGVSETTLLKCVMGLEAVRDGTITFKDIPIQKLAAEKRANYKIGYVPQGREIFSQLTVEENLRTGLVANKGHTLPAIIYELFPVLKEMKDVGVVTCQVGNNS